MASVKKNTNGKRNRDISVVYNPGTGNYIKKDAKTGKYTVLKDVESIQKGIRHKRTNIKANPSVKRIIALKAEKSVINLMNNRIVK
jgi:hypothetical protein